MTGARQLVGRWDAVAEDQLADGLRGFVGQGAELVAVFQQQVADLTFDYVRDLSRLELGKVAVADQLEANAGQTFDGRPLTAALSATPAKVLLALKQGKPLAEALRFGRFAVARLTQTEIMDAARIELQHQLENGDRVKGWRWRSRGTCGACLALDNGSTRKPGDPLEGHPYCQCIQEVAYSVKERAQRETGHARFAQLDDQAKVAAVGKTAAALLGAGLVKLDDVVATQSSREWRGMVTLATAEDLTRKAGISDDELRKLLAENPEDVGTAA